MKTPRQLAEELLQEHGAETANQWMGNQSQCKCIDTFLSGLKEWLEGKKILVNEKVFKLSDYGRGHNELIDELIKEIEG